ncbi:FHA domain-containing protein [Ilumatobacter nonamiensis]|uniref:FHA domain-containing protein n=1 Tax=Ilumatobacter nonamiensis TaxID=467093 RepID=UPI00130DA791|nr:FHA domain-containing protein [Ilumatobacter nonamiensis]
MSGRDADGTSDPGPLDIGPLRIADGTGIVARSASAVLFVATASAAGQPDLVAAFSAAEPGSEASRVTAAAADASFDVPAFAAVDLRVPLRVIAFGAVEIHTDHPSLPMLSAAASTSWVERQLDVGDSTVTISIGASPNPATDLRLGCVAGGGFTLEVAGRHAAAPMPTQTAGTPTPESAPAPSVTAERELEPRVSAVDQPSSVDHTTGDADPTTPIARTAVDGFAALRAAMEQPGAVQDDVTLAPPIGGRSPDRADSTGGRPQTRSRSDDPDRPFVLAVHCTSGHPNPPQRSTCRRCMAPIDSSRPAANVRQPVLAVIRLPDGTQHSVDRQLVLGRRPDLAAARADRSAASVRMSDESSVSRTHLRIDVEDWSINVVDCGSRSGTALVSGNDAEPELLDAWVPHEVAAGAQLYLGGPTIVTVMAAPLDEEVDVDG